MFKKISLTHLVIIFSATIFLYSTQFSWADPNSFTVNIPNGQGGYTAVVIEQSGSGYIGPQGEYYPQFPTVAQLQVMYGGNAPAPNVVVEPSAPQEEDDSITIAPPAIPEYEQPEAPGPEYNWVPGYWAYDSFFEDYYWVPGTWVTAPEPGLVWTPGYWRWRGGNFVFSEGYWGDHIGFYGGVNYGHGYRGSSNSSYNGGPGGTNDRPTPEQGATNERHLPPTSEQTAHVQSARNNPVFRASVNYGRPTIAATTRPGEFRGEGIVAAKQTGILYKKTKAVKTNKPAVSAKPTGPAAHPNTQPQAFKPGPKPVRPIVNKPKPKVPIKKPVPPAQPTQPAQPTPSSNGANTPNKNTSSSTSSTS